MNTIRLEIIKPSPNPVRKTWDEEKMQELAQSIREQGVVVPIKVRPSDNIYYEIVYGHRRVEAARRAGLDEIPAIVESPDDTDALIQALIENIMREDMPAYDKGAAVLRLQERTMWTLREMERRGIATRNNLSMWVTFKKERDSGVSLISDTYGDGIEQTIQIKRVLGDDTKSKIKVADKVKRERLDRFDTRAVADAYAKAETPELKQAVLETEIKKGDIKLTTPDAILREANRKLGRDHAVNFERGKRQEKEQDRLQIRDGAVKEFITQTDAYFRSIDNAIRDIDYGRYSPEAARFVARKLESMENKINTLIDILRGVS